MYIIIKVYSLSPKIYSIINKEDSTIVLYITHDTLRYFKLQEGEWKFLNIDEIKDFNYKIIRQRFFEYLSKREVSPNKALEWLKKRKLDHYLIDKYMEEARMMGFISEDRYIDIILEKYKRSGKSLWYIKNKLRQAGIKEDKISNILFDEKEVLKNYILKNLNKLKKDKRKFINHLLYKGFKYENIINTLNYIEESENL